MACRHPLQVLCIGLPALRRFLASLAVFGGDNLRLWFLIICTGEIIANANEDDCGCDVIVVVVVVFLPAQVSASLRCPRVRRKGSEPCVACCPHLEAP